MPHSSEVNHYINSQICDLQDKAHCSPEATYTYHTAINGLNFKMIDYIKIDFMFLHEV
jgi:hypothetical protein